MNATAVSPVIEKKLHARLFMGSYVILHFLRKLNPFGRRRGLAHFQANFFSEGLYAPGARVRELLPGSQRCIACHLCLRSGVPPSMLSPRDMVLRVFRSTGEWKVARPLLAPLEAYRGAERFCPERIPLGALATVLAAPE